MKGVGFFYDDEAKTSKVEFADVFVEKQSDNENGYVMRVQHQENGLRILKCPVILKGEFNGNEMSYFKGWE